MKHYYITTMYTQSTQVAIQQDHACKEMFKEVLNNIESDESKLFIEYINKHKTTISLGVGHYDELLRIYSYIFKHKNTLKIPFGIFQEASLNMTPTCLTFVVPEKYCVNIRSAIESLMKEFFVSNISELAPRLSVDEVYNKLGIKVKIIEDESNNYKFRIKSKVYIPPSEYNNDLINGDLNNSSFMDKVFEKYNENSESNFKYVEYDYTLEELNFYTMINSLRLK